MMLVVDVTHAEKAIALLAQAGETAFRVGDVEASTSAEPEVVIR
jgi:phosphoribosylaminoimidazole (AIR) synthetase